MDTQLVLSTARVEDLPGIDRELRAWQVEGEPLQLHPGDVGWGCRRGLGATAAALRTWRASGGEGRAAGLLVAVGFLDEPDLLRLALAPTAVADPVVAEEVARSLADPDRGVLPAGETFVEAPVGAAVHPALAALGWGVDEPWTPLRRDLAVPVEDPRARVETVGGDREPDWSSVLRAAFENISGLDDATMRRRWRAMHEAPAARDSPSVVVYDDAGAPVAAATVWPAGPGRPGLVEPVGVHPDHRGHGYGRAASLAAARALQELGSSSATVCTPSSHVAAVATYVSAGFGPEPQRRDRRRPPHTG